MIASAGLGIFMTTMFKNEEFHFQTFLDTIQYVPLIMFIVVLCLSRKFPKLHPIALLCGCALAGIVLQL